MTTTSQPMRNPADRGFPRGRPPPLTFGRPRRSRRRIGPSPTPPRPLFRSPSVGIGAIVIHGYHAYQTIATQSTVVTTRDASAETGTDHAPTGPDVGTEGLNAQLTGRSPGRDAALADHVTTIVSGYRTAATQQDSSTRAIQNWLGQGGHRWVLPPEKSEHVKGSAVDVGPHAAARWLKTNGVKFGLCQRYANRYWHFEVLAPARVRPVPPWSRTPPPADTGGVRALRRDLAPVSRAVPPSRCVCRGPSPRPASDRRPSA